MIRVITRKTPHKKARVVRRWLKDLSKVTEVRHNLLVVIFGHLKSMEWVDPNKESRLKMLGGFGRIDRDKSTFKKIKKHFLSKRDKKVPWDALILLAGDHDVGDLVYVVTHEMVHYEQFRDGRKGTERGVSVRLENLTDKVFKLVKAEHESRKKAAKKRVQKGRLYKR